VQVARQTLAFLQDGGDSGGCAVHWLAVHEGMSPVRGCNRDAWRNRSNRARCWRCLILFVNQQVGWVFRRRAGRANLDRPALGERA
jgi:hypothetical protein